MPATRAVSTESGNARPRPILFGALAGTSLRRNVNSELRPPIGRSGRVRPIKRSILRARAPRAGRSCSDGAAEMTAGRFLMFESVEERDDVGAVQRGDVHALVGPMQAQAVAQFANTIDVITQPDDVGAPPHRQFLKDPVFRRVAQPGWAITVKSMRLRSCPNTVMSQMSLCCSASGVIRDTADCNSCTIGRTCLGSCSTSKPTMVPAWAVSEMSRQKGAVGRGR